MGNQQLPESLDATPRWTQFRLADSRVLAEFLLPGTFAHDSQSLPCFQTLFLACYSCWMSDGLAHETKRASAFNTSAEPERVPSFDAANHACSHRMADRGTMDVTMGSIAPTGLKGKLAALEAQPRRMACDGVATKQKQPVQKMVQA